MQYCKKIVQEIISVTKGYYSTIVALVPAQECAFLESTPLLFDEWCVSGFTALYIFYHALEMVKESKTLPSLLFLYSKSSEE